MLQEVCMVFSLVDDPDIYVHTRPFTILVHIPVDGEDLSVVTLRSAGLV